MPVLFAALVWLLFAASGLYAQQCVSIACPASQTYYVCNTNGLWVYYTPIATNSCNPNDLTVACNPPSGHWFTLGSTTVDCTVYGSGFSNHCSFTITVLQDPACQPLTNCPIAHCSTNIMRYMPCGSNCVPVYFNTWGENLCNPSNVLVTTSPISGTYFSLGDHTVDVWATAGGQTNHCSFTVTVLPDSNCPPPGGCTNCNTGNCSSNLLVNGSFESPGVPDGYVALGGGDAVITGWVTALNGVEYYNPVAAPSFVNTGIAADGNFLLDIAPANALGGGIRQTLTTVPGKSYRVSFMMGTSKERGRNGNASLTVTVAGTAHAFNVSTENPNITWARKEFSFVPPAGSTSSTLVFSTLDDPALSFVNLDDVRVSDCCEDAGLKIRPTVTVEWKCGILQSASTVTGPYTDVPGATSPYTAPTDGSQRYFRTRQPAY